QKSDPKSDSKSNSGGERKPAQSDPSKPAQDSKPPAELSQLSQKLKEQQGPTNPPEQASQASPEGPPLDPEAILEPAVSGAAELAKWAFYAAVVLGILYVLWRSWAEVWSAVREFLAGLRDFWNGLWGRKQVGRIGPSAEEILAQLPPPPFSSYADPFASGIAGRYSTEELVRYSFEAFEAWSREHGCSRQPDQTPHELARDVSGRVPAMASDARHLAELYSRAAFDRGTLPKASAERLRELWQHMRAGAARPF
ncbi:MAG TPA: DUF4129 domain-containing protein, partial [Pirellulales bacterium]|nr:DUF4129 domain-containing protein [Pirellulales bacterium]